MFSLLIITDNNNPIRRGYIIWVKDIWKTENITAVKIIEAGFPKFFKPEKIMPLNNISSKIAGKTASETIETK